jgi:Fic family protein
MDGREYLETHPWITFTHAAHYSELWALLGEAFSKVRHLAGAPLQPGLARELGDIYMAKGALATTAIEGNTLTEAEALEILSDRKKLPESRAYLAQEIRNVYSALNEVRLNAVTGKPFILSTEWVCQQNAAVLRDLPVEEYVDPGRFRTVGVAAGNYRGAPAEDVPYLVDQLTDWLNRAWLSPSGEVDVPEDLLFIRAFFGATLAHLYLAWIHPFGDGNGRTARLVEAAILAHSGVVPWVACNLLSDHYNKTRTVYYQRLDAASRRNDVDGFIGYAVRGFVDSLREQIDTVQHMQKTTAWVNYVHEIIGHEPAGETRERRRTLVLCLKEGEAITKSGVRRLDFDLNEMYHGKSEKTITRDLNKLVELNLMRHEGPTYTSAIDVMDAFLTIHSDKASPAQNILTLLSQRQPSAGTGNRRRMT